MSYIDKKPKKEESGNNDSGWSQALTACAVMMFISMIFTASNINVPIITAIGSGVSIMAYVKSKQEGNKSYMLYSILMLVLFFGYAYMARKTMDKAMKDMSRYTSVHETCCEQETAC